MMCTILAHSTGFEVMRRFSYNDYRFYNAYMAITQLSRQVSTTDAVRDLAQA